MISIKCYEFYIRVLCRNLYFIIVTTVIMASTNSNNPVDAKVIRDTIVDKIIDTEIKGLIIIIIPVLQYPVATSSALKGIQY